MCQTRADWYDSPLEKHKGNHCVFTLTGIEAQPVHPFLGSSHGHNHRPVCGLPCDGQVQSWALVFSRCQSCGQQPLISHVVMYGSRLLWLRGTGPKADRLKLDHHSVGPNTKKKKILGMAGSGGCMIPKRVSFLRSPSTALVSRSGWPPRREQTAIWKLCSALVSHSIAPTTGRAPLCPSGFKKSPRIDSHWPALSHIFISIP